MTEYETASLALQCYAVIARVLIGAVQCVLIGGGLWLMKKAASARDAQHQEAKDQHRETMTALQQQGEALHALTQGADNRHQESMAALRALIERTAPSA